MTDKRLAQIVEWLDDTGPESWWFDSQDEEGYWPDSRGRILGKGDVLVADGVGRRNGIFIIHSREIIRELLEEIAMIKGEVDEHR